jgi:hypothetical protein
MTIQKQFQIYKIRQLQLDPFGICNAKCWFCPVKYIGNSANGKEIMSPELLEKIIKNLIDEREKPNGLVHKKFRTFYTAHYNEILLYPHFEQLLQICQKYRLQFIVLSNGIPLTPQKIDLIVKYKDVVNGICLNIPAFEPELWSLRSGINKNQFSKLISNINYAVEKLPEMVSSGLFSIQINGFNHNSFNDNGGLIEKGPEFPSDMDLDINNGELSNQTKKARQLFPRIKVFNITSLIDRAGLLKNIITNNPEIERNINSENGGEKVIGCSNDIEFGGRPFGWIHVNASGKVFLCCNDYDMEIQFGDFKTQELKDFWGKYYHQEKIQESFDTICKKCVHAVFDKSKYII